METILSKVKLALRIMTNDFDIEITDLISACIKELECTGIVVNTEDTLIIRIISTYCKMNFGNSEDYEKLKRSYDEQKMQLMGFTEYEQITND